MSKRNYIWFAAAAVVGGFLWKSGAFKSKPKTFMAARWDGDRFVGDQCWNADQKIWVPNAQCGRK